MPQQLLSQPIDADGERLDGPGSLGERQRLGALGASLGAVEPPPYLECPPRDFFALPAQWGALFETPPIRAARRALGRLKYAETSAAAAQSAQWAAAAASYSEARTSPLPSKPLPRSTPPLAPHPQLLPHPRL